MMEVEIDPTRKWLGELKLAKREDEKWVKRAKKIVKRYRDERQGWSDTTKRYNILWANIQTTLPALYGKTPRAQVERRWKDQDPVGRTASQIMERVLQYEIDHYGDFDAGVKAAVLDRLLVGRGTVWVRFEAKEVAIPEPIEEQAEAQAEAMGQPEPEEPEYECTPVDYVFWEDFRCSPARNWEEVTWVARRVYMSRKDGEERFGEIFKEVPLTHEPIGLEEMQKSGDIDTDSMKKAQVWEIWCKADKTVHWVAEGFDCQLDEREDPYGLDCFWPCPKPLFATQTTDTLVPVPDYALYQDQAEELDKVTNRIGMLVDAVKIVGVYDASQAGVQRMLSEGVNNTLIPVDTWAAFAEKGGVKGVIDFLPLDQVIQALAQMYVAREQTKQVIYEVTGLSDIIRGASNASETATAQQIKSQYGSLRLRRSQMEVAQFASEVLRIKGQLIADFYSPQTLIAMSGIMSTQDAQHAEQAVQLLKSEPARNFRIEIASDSLVEMDEQTEKESRMEFLTAAGSFLERALPVAQQVPELAPLMGEMLLYGVRAFRGGRPMEAAFDDAIAKMTAPKQPAPPQPTPEQVQAQADLQKSAQQEQTKQAQAQADVQKEQIKAAERVEMERIRREFDVQITAMNQSFEERLAKFKVEQDNSTKLQIASMQQDTAVQKLAGQQVSGAKDEVLSGISELVNGFVAQIQDAMENQRQMTEQLAQTVNAPREIVRGPDGRAIGVRVNGVVREIQRGSDGRAIGV